MRIIIISLAFVVSGALADAQLNQEAQYAHIPYDAENTDNELYIGSIGTNAVIQYADTQSGTYIGTVEMDCSALPPQLASLPHGQSLQISSDDTGETCTLTDVNGDTRNLETWKTTVKRSRFPRLYSDFCRFQLSIKCTQ